MSKPGKYYVIYDDENAIDSPGFDTRLEAEQFMRYNPDYLTSNGDTEDCYSVQFVTDAELAEAKEI